ncbi:hypothetical protein Pint_19620 [Pistacia integerrima]|uniref:Uncharacterized protein n=1 Tax=Pistacia integerrima TaxID=434235 RepID=A0ACC0XEE3_9ROSI|nr:hypothetical protein Pint_19620 [Pistacia integerrima]
MLKFDPFRHCPQMVLRPLGFVIVLGLCGVLTLELLLSTKQTAHAIASETYGARNRSFSEIETAARLLYPLNSSAIKLSRSLSSLLDGTELSFDAIVTKVAPTLFIALSTIPQLSQVSFIGLHGLLFSYYVDGDRTLAVYSNASFSSTWYTQPVNHDTGVFYGTPVPSNPLFSVNATWFQEALNSTSGHSSFGTGWNNAEDSLYYNTVAMDTRGVICLGFPSKVVIERFAALDFPGGDFHLATTDGQVIMQTKLQNIQMVINNTTVLLQKLLPNGDPANNIANLSCTSNDGKSSNFHEKFIGVHHVFFCSTLEIAGVQSVYVLVYPRGGLLSLVSRNRKLSLIYVVLMLVAVTISLSTFIFLITKAAKREMFLCAALIKQMNATQQAERKSMNKTFALAKASHDVRASLAAITGLVELCHEDANPQTELAENLGLIKTCTKDLLGILNSVLEMSKMEAGKLELKEEEFNLAQLLEEVVDLYYHVGIKKGIDIVLDPCDGSVLGLCLVKGDRVKLKQILCNLLSNAIKFTSEGHVSVRAMVKKKSFKQDIIASNHNIVLQCLSKMFFKNKEGFNDLNALHSVEENPNLMVFEFEVDDTGKGIPKDKQNSVFEEFVQVKETALGHEGIGLGLGIVQSMVHLMKGEITIVEKEHGERGTCFKFNILLTLCEQESIDTNEEHLRAHNDWPQSGFHQHLAAFWNPAPKLDGSHIILFITGEERRRVLKRYIENNLNIRVTIVRQEKMLHQELKKIKRKMDPSCSGKPESNVVDILTISASSNSDTGPSDGAQGIIQEGSDNVLPYHRRTNSKNCSSFTLVVIDASAGSLSELFKTLSNFTKEIPSFSCKFVWLHNPIMRNSHLREHQEYQLIPPCDHVINKPFHGSRLIEVLKLLPECKSTSHSQRSFRKLKMTSTSQEIQYSPDPNPSNKSKGLRAETGTSSSPSHYPSIEQTVLHSDGKSNEKPLNGKKILIVEDAAAMIKLTTTRISKLGANVEVCTNGKEAFDQVCKNMSDARKEGHSKTLPYDYIIMDCEMPVMDGFEATRLIRREEEEYSVHTPIIALTAHAVAEEEGKIANAGMDFHLTKPLQVEELLDVIHSIDEKWKNISKQQACV